MSIRFLQGDCRAVLPTLADRSVQCVVTSPPYFGLRDYGTGIWEGGDPFCDHSRKVVGGPKQTEGNGSANGHASKADKLARTTCVCGATRADSQIGLEATPAAYVAELVAVFREVRRVLRDDGTVWLNLGDSYANDTKGGGSTGGKHVSSLHGDSGVGRGKRCTGVKSKDLMMIPARVAIALCDDGWYLRSDIIWAKPNPMPESVQDRPTSSHEHVFLLTKRPTYFYDAEAVREPALYPDGPNAPDKIQSSMGQGFTRRAPLIGPDRKALPGPTSNRHRAGIPGGQSLEAQPGGTRNMRNVWTIATAPFSEAHFATFPPDLAERCIKAGSKPGDTILDPFGGAGTVGLVADRLYRNAVLIELNPDYVAMAQARVVDDAPLLVSLAVSSS